jgi:hypothetical protein
MTTHHLKTHPAPFADVEAGRKTFEIRKDDRGYKVGDTLVLEEWDAEKASTLYRELWREYASDGDFDGATAAARADAIHRAYTGHTCTRVVSYIFDPQGERYGLEAGYVVLGLSAGGAPL